MSNTLDTAVRRDVLYAAFLKARSWLWEQPYYDTAEVQLFEWKLGENLAELSRFLRSGYAFQPLVGYHIPKDQKSSRPFAYRAFPDEIASVAVVLASAFRLERAMDAGGRVSFGNRLERRLSSDRLFLPWETAWGGLERACVSSTRRHAWYLRTDVRQFYPAVRRRILDRTLADLLGSDPSLGFFRSLIHQPTPLLANGDDGLPTGPAASGYLANLYLLPLDRIIKGPWRASARFRRYVDDIFFFATTRPGAVSAHRSLVRLAGKRFGLTLHDARKTEFSSTRGFGLSGRPPADWERAERLFDSVYGSLYRLPPRLQQRFLEEPDRLLKWYCRGLRWLGINVSTDWLAQRLLSVRARGRGSRWIPEKGGARLDIPDVELFDVERRGMKAWAEEFSRRNPGFLRDLRRLERSIRRLTRQAYAHLGDVRRQSKKEMKGRIFTLRRFAARLAMMRCAADAPIFNMLIDHPWILDPSLSIQAFISMPHAIDRLRHYLSDERPVLVRAKAAWAIGELGDPRAVRTLWDFAVHGRGEIARRSALEALLRIDVWSEIPAEWVTSEATRERSPGVRKYYYLILGRIRPPGVEAFLASALERETNFIVRRAAEYALAEAGSVYARAAIRAKTPEPRASVPSAHPAERR